MVVLTVGCDGVSKRAMPKPYNAARSPHTSVVWSENAVRRNVFGVEPTLEPVGASVSAGRMRRFDRPSRLTPFCPLAEGNHRPRAPHSAIRPRLSQPPKPSRRATLTAFSAARTVSLRPPRLGRIAAGEKPATYAADARTTKGVFGALASVCIASGKGEVVDLLLA